MVTRHLLTLQCVLFALSQVVASPLSGDVDLYQT